MLIYSSTKVYTWYEKMGRNISIYPLSEVSSLIYSLESIPDRLSGKLYTQIQKLLKLVSSYIKEGNNVSKDKVELIFWVHKAFVIGFILALTITSLR